MFGADAGSAHDASAEGSEDRSGGDSTSDKAAMCKDARMNRSYRLFAASCMPLVLAAGCAQVSAVRNPETPACVASLRQAFGDILAAQGEAPQAVAQLVQHGADPVLLRHNGPRPLFLRSPSGIDYGLFFDRRENACLLRLYMRRQGFSTYTNNVTYIDTRTVGGCDCGP